MAPNNIKYIWMNGELVDVDKATVSFLASGLHYGLGVFEGIRAYDTDKGPAVFRLRDHMTRLLQSAHIMGFPKLPYTVDTLMEAVRETIRANGFKDCYIRPHIYLNGNLPSLIIERNSSHIGIAVWDMGAYLGADTLEKGIRANVSSFTRHHVNVMMTKAKSAGNYVNSALAKSESLKNGYDEAILLDPQGFVAECTGENIFLVRKGKLYTTPTGSVLEGITRDSLIALVGQMGIPVVEQLISRDQLYIADEVFVCGTAAECVAVTDIDGRIIGQGSMGPVTRNIQQAFFSALRGKHPLSAGWLDYVNP